MTNFVSFSTGGAEAGAAPLERLRPQQKKGGSGSATLIKTSVAEPELEPEPEEPKLFVVPEPLLAISALAPRLRRRNYLFD